MNLTSPDLPNRFVRSVGPENRVIKLELIRKTYCRCLYPRPHWPLHSPQLPHSFQIDTVQKFSNPNRLESLSFSGFRTDPLKRSILLNNIELVLRLKL